MWRRARNNDAHGAPPPLGSPGGCHRHPRMTNGRWSLSTRLYLSGSPCLVVRDPLWRFSRRGPSPPARSPCSYAHVIYAWLWPNSPTELLRPTAASARAHEAHCELKIPTDSLQKHSSSACTEFVVECTGDSISPRNRTARVALRALFAVLSFNLSFETLRVYICFYITSHVA